MIEQVEPGQVWVHSGGVECILVLEPLGGGKVLVYNITKKPDNLLDTTWMFAHTLCDDRSGWQRVA